VAAHELNEDLTVLACGAERLCEMVAPGSPAAQLLSDILGASQRLAYLATDLLVYGIERSGYPRCVVTAKRLMEPPETQVIL